jgi:hypothetical protein
MGHSFLAEMISKLPSTNQYLIIADAGPMGTRDCVNLCLQSKLKFLICVSGSKQIKPWVSVKDNLQQGRNIIFALTKFRRMESVLSF